ncbi:MAG: hypothetical protein U0Q21_01420 [Dermatophilaceae bacterium]
MFVPIPPQEFSPSLNRMPLADLPGLPAGAAGSLAHDWLATWGFARQVSAEPEAVLGIRTLGCELPDLPDGPVSPELMAASTPWPAGLDAMVSAGPQAVGYAAATRVADRLGRALGGLAATLVRGDGASRAARPDWPAAHWARWSGARRIALGGGNLRGELGRRIHVAAGDVLSRNGVDVVLDLALPVERLVLRGAAGCLEAGVALDCGGTVLKATAVAGGRPTGLLQVTPTPARVSAGAVVEAIAAAAAPLIAASRVVDPVPVSIALATYVDPAGQPYAGQLGVYAPLGEIPLGEVLGEAMTRHTGRPVVLWIAHDGACALAGARLDHPDTGAAIVLGTAIGSGLRGRRRGPIHSLEHDIHVI